MDFGSNFGMPAAGFDALIAKKYALMQQQNDTQAIGTIAAAGLDNVRTKLLPGQTAADIAKTQAETGQIGATTKTIPLLANSTIKLQGLQGGYYGAQTRNTDETTTGLKIDNRESAYGLLGAQPGLPTRFGFRL